MKEGENCVFYETCYLYESIYRVYAIILKKQYVR